MAATKPQPGVVWPLWVLLFVGWVLMLSGVAALQKASWHNYSQSQQCDGAAKARCVENTRIPVHMFVDQNSLMILLKNNIFLTFDTMHFMQSCTAGDTSNILAAGSAAYLSPVPCGKFYRFTWWIIWYLFAIMIMVAVFAAARTFHTFRAGILGLCAPLLILLMDTCNVFFYFNGLSLSGTVKARARVTLAGAVIATIGLFVFILAVGLFDEEKGKAARRGGTGEPEGQTYGGVYNPSPAQKGTAEAATYAYPTRE